MIVSSDINPWPPQPAPLPRIDSSNWCRRPEIGPRSEFHRRSVFICQENIHALLSRVSSARLSVCLLVSCSAEFLEVFVTIIKKGFSLQQKHIFFI